MAFGCLQVTQTGRIKLANAQDGKSLRFTSLLIGDGNYTGSFNDITGLVHQLYAVPVTVSIHNDIVQLDADISNLNNDKGYYFREIGILATQDEKETFLYAYDNAGLDAEYINAGSNVIIDKRIRLELYIANNVNITVNNSGGLYALKTELDDLDKIKLDKSGNAKNLKSDIDDIEERITLQSADPFSKILGKINRWLGDLKKVAFSGSYNDLNDKPTSYPPTDHTHDNRYYTEYEIDSKLSDKAESNHNHSGVYEPAFVKNDAFNKNFGATADTVCQGNDARLSDARTPKSHTHTKSQISDMPTKLSQFSNDSGYQNSSQVNAAVATVDNKLKNQCNQNRIELTNSSFYPVTIGYRSGQVVYLKCSGTLEKEVPANAGYVVALSMPTEYCPNVDITAYPNISYAGKNIRVEITTAGRVIFTTPEKLPVGFGLNMHFTYMTGKSNF